MVYRCEELKKKARDAHDRLCQNVSTMLEATVMDYEVDVSGGCPDEERRAGRGRRVRGKGTKGGGTLT